MVALALAGTVIAAPSADANPRMWWQGVDANGHPKVHQYLGEPGAPVEWHACIDGGGCWPLDETGPVLEPGPTPVGTYFGALPGPNYRVTSEWLGQLVKRADPALTGDPVVGQRVTVHPGRWTGGWYPATDGALWSCETADGEGCRRLAFQSAKLGPEEAGRYLFATAWYLRRDDRLSEPPVTQRSIDHPVTGPYGPVADSPVEPTPTPTPPTGANPRMWWQGVDAHGNPRIHQYLGEPGAPVEWHACIDGGGCWPLDETGPVLEPGPTPVGTYFGSLPGRNYRVSDEWLGQLVKHADPALTGEPVVGRTITVHPGRWTGGWYPATDGALWSCATADGTGCERLAWQSATLGPDQVGRYLFATAWYLRRDDRLSEPPISQRSIDHPVTGPYGPVTGADVPITPAPKPEVAVVSAPGPKVMVRARALRAKGRLNLGRVTCARSCKVGVKLSGGGRKAYTRSFVAKQGVTRITAPVRRGKLTLRVHVDGKLLAKRKVVAR